MEELQTKDPNKDFFLDGLLVSDIMISSVFFFFSFPIIAKSM
jgi:hypothetical protein